MSFADDFPSLKGKELRPFGDDLFGLDGFENEETGLTYSPEEEVVAIKDLQNNCLDRQRIIDIFKNIIKVSEELANKAYAHYGADSGSDKALEYCANNYAVNMLRADVAKQIIKELGLEPKASSNMGNTKVIK